MERSGLGGGAERHRLKYKSVSSSGAVLLLEPVTKNLKIYCFPVGRWFYVKLSHFCCCWSKREWADTTCGVFPTAETCPQASISSKKWASLPGRWLCLLHLLLLLRNDPGRVNPFPPATLLLLHYTTPPILHLPTSICKWSGLSAYCHLQPAQPFITCQRLPAPSTLNCSLSDLQNREWCPCSPRGEEKQASKEENDGQSRTIFLFLGRIRTGQEKETSLEKK